MDSMQKILSSSANLHKSLDIMNEHSSALQTFAQEYPNLQDEYRNAATLQMAGNHLWAMQGISKSLLGLQSILEQSSLRIVNAIAEQHKPLIQNPVRDMLEKIAGQTDTANAIAEQRKLSSDLLKDMFRKTALYSSLGCVVDLVEGQHSLKRDFTLQALMRDSGFLSQIANQSPFISAVQAQMPKMAKILGTENVIAKIATASPVLESVFPLAMALFDFYSELDKLSVTKQQRVVNLLEQINLDDEIDEELQENLFAETRIDFSPYLESFQNFCKNNAFNIWALQMGYETFIKDTTEKDFSNIFFDILFVICFLVLISNLPSGGDDK